ncbi:MAG TPA: DUF4442 domain-containing protein [Chitinophagaceae bacterium]|nr:DUF4442 domain-containing protein [Chitinophagaceae bacterium]
MSPTQQFIQLTRHPVKFRLFLLSKLPAAYFSGVRIRYIDEQRCKVTIPFKWFTQNPFRSTYFACLSMAAEMSTGALGMAHLRGRKPAVSMLVVKVESEYFKRATGLTTFICDDGDLLRQAIEETIRTGEPATVRAASAGINEREETVALFYITWSFKVRTV